MKFRLATSLSLILVSTVTALAQDAPFNGPPNAPNQQPQHPDQTRAPLPETLTSPVIAPVAVGLPQLWALEFLPDGHMLVTAKEGRMFIVSPDGDVGPEIAGLPAVDAAGQGGLLDVALAPDFERSGRIFFSFSEPRSGGNGTSVASAELVRDETGGGQLNDVKVIFQQTPTINGRNHYGSRLVFGTEGELYVTVGERSDAAVRVQSQDVGSGLGKVFRISQTGEPLSDNPFVNIDGALPEVWSLGHRNMQSAALDNQGRLWTVEHGPRGGDELNMPQAGMNYGWPEVTYGIDYSGAPIGDGVTATSDTEQPIYYWDPVIAPSGMAFYESEMFPEWQGTFLVGGLVAQAIVILHMENDRVVAEERVPVGARVRDVKVAPDGSVFAITEQRGAGSEIIRLTNEVS